MVQFTLGGSRPMQRRAFDRSIVAAVLGNALDWYDFIVYGYLASVISTQFFPAGSDWMPILSTLAVFAVSFFVRPVGGVIVAHYADIVGRKTMMIWIIGCMTAGTAMLCLVPPYAMIGIMAPVIVIIARTLQGLAAGGEYATATAFLIEHAPHGSRGLYGGWQLSGQGAAILLSALLATLVTRTTTPEQLQSWGWRLPFLVGLLVGPVGLYMRMKASDTPEFLSTERQTDMRRLRGAFKLLLSDYKRRLFCGIGLVIGGTAAFYVLFIFMPTYALRVLKLDAGQSFLAPAVAGLVIMMACPVTGYLSDHFGRKPLLIAATATLVATLYPTFVWLQETPSLAKLAIVECGFGLLVSIYAGPFSAAIAELYPVTIRASAIAVAYNFGVAVFGGLSPLIVAWLISGTGDALAPAYYVTACMVVTLIAAASLPSTRREANTR